MTAKLSSAFFGTQKKKRPQKKPLPHTQKTIYDVLSLFHYHFFYQSITIPFNGDVIDTFIQVT